MQASRAVVRQFAKKQVVPRRYAHHEPAPQSTYNDLPQPSGSWQTDFDSNQRRYNMHLAAGIAAITGTLLFGKATGVFEFHNDLPAKPAVIESYK